MTAVLTTCQLTPHARPTPHTDSRCNNLSHRDWPSTSHPQRQGHAGAANILRHRHHHLDGRSVTSPSSVATSPSGTCGCRGAVPVCVCARVRLSSVHSRSHTHQHAYTLPLAHATHSTETILMVRVRMARKLCVCLLKVSYLWHATYPVVHLLKILYSEEDNASLIVQPL